MYTRTCVNKICRFRFTILLHTILLNEGKNEINTLIEKKLKTWTADHFIAVTSQGYITNLLRENVIKKIQG
jgi:hypothetical protein